MKRISNVMKVIKESIHLENFDDIIDNFIKDISFRISSLYHTNQHKKAKRLEKKVINFLQTVRNMKNLVL